MLRAQTLISMYFKISARSADECMYSKNTIRSLGCGPTQKYEDKAGGWTFVNLLPWHR